MCNMELALDRTVPLVSVCTMDPCHEGVAQEMGLATAKHLLDDIRSEEKEQSQVCAVCEQVHMAEVLEYRSNVYMKQCSCPVNHWRGWFVTTFSGIYRFGCSRLDTCVDRWSH